MSIQSVKYSLRLFMSNATLELQVINYSSVHYIIRQLRVHTIEHANKDVIEESADKDIMNYSEEICGPR